MFYYLNGTLALVDANLAVIDCGGVGYACYTTNYTLAKLQLGKPAKLFTYCSIKEDAFDIYGFTTREELSCFRQLLSVSGVGPKAALAILSVSSPQKLQLAIASGDEKALTCAPGVGKKLAQRILLELKDKWKLGSAPTFLPEAVSSTAAQDSQQAQATAALSALGYAPTEVAAALKGIDLQQNSVSEIVRQALRNMVQNR